MAKPSKGSSPKRGRPGGFRHHERAPDPASEVDRPLEPKARPGSVTPEHDPNGPPHHRLNRPVGEPNPAADSDPFEPHPEAEDPPPPRAPSRSGTRARRARRAGRLRTGGEPAGQRVGAVAPPRARGRRPGPTRSSAPRPPRGTTSRTRTPPRHSGS